MERTKKIIALLLMLCMVMCFGLSACGSNGSEDPGTDQQEEQQSEASTAAPEIKGLTFESELEKEYADQFSVYRYEGGYKYFHIVDGDDFLLVPEGGEIGRAHV